MMSDELRTGLAFSASESLSDTEAKIIKTPTGT
jgi:hypothetical protein